MLKLLAIVFVLLLPACGHQKGSYSTTALKKKKIPLYIPMPHNPLAFDDISSLIYTSMYEHCDRIGYTMVDSNKHGYSLVIRIKGLEPQQKLVSPDIVLMHAYMNLDLECQLKNFNQEIVAEKRFSFSTLVSKPQNPALVSDYKDFAYRKLFARSAPKIERFFRSFLCDAFSEDDA